jgi:pilus assembly protein Flp/PilA
MIRGKQDMRLVATLRALLADTRGATAVEYGLIVALIFLAILGAVRGFGVSVGNMYNKVSSTTTAAVNH